MKAAVSHRRFLIVALFAFALLSACARDFTWEYEEINRITSPDGVVDAVWVRGSGGATTGFIYSLYLVPKGLKFNRDDPAFKRDSFSVEYSADLNFVWREPKLLEIRFRQARIVHFSNYWRYWNSQDPNNAPKYVVELKLAPLTEGSALSDEDRQPK